jgi:alpha-mannosidase
MRFSAISAILAIATMATVGGSASVSDEQFKASVEQRIRILRQVEGCTEGFAEALSGDTIVYPRLRSDVPEALLTRATTGKMEMGWRSAPVALSPLPFVSFVVAAGFDRERAPGHRFAMSVDGSKLFEFSTGDSETWSVNRPDGSQLDFDGVMSDQHGDVFGYLRITIPTSRVAAGRPAEFQVVGEKAGSNAWFMVFKDRGVIPFLRETVDNEAYLDLTIEPAGGGAHFTAVAASSWAGRELRLAADNGNEGSASLGLDSGHAAASFDWPERPVGTLRVLAGSELIATVPDLRTDASESSVHRSKLASVTGKALTGGGYRVEYRSMHAASLGDSLLALSKAGNRAGAQRLIISTHQDIAWMDSPEQCVRDRDEKIITPLLALMAKNPAYRFDLEDVLCLREYLERHPGRRTELHRLLRSGRLTVGASFNQPYEDLCSAEMLARQFLAGRKWLRDNFPGCDSRTYWNPDVPGRTLQMPQILRHAGVSYLVMSRFARGLFRWSSPDGSEILAFSPGHYGDFRDHTRSKDFPDIAAYLAAAGLEWMKAVPSTATKIPVLSMSDMSGPEDFDDLIERWNRIKSLRQDDGSDTRLRLPPIRYSGMQEYLDEVGAINRMVPEIRGERPNIWLYIHGPTHHEAISAKREADILLPAAETFATIEALQRGSFAKYPQRELTAAWEAQLYPDHGWGGKNGDITDNAFRAKYESARNTAGRLLSSALGSVARLVRSEPLKGIPVTVFNSQSWARSGPVECRADFPPGRFPKWLRVSNTAGRPVPTQVLSSTRHEDGSLKSVDLLFVAQDVPSVGYSTHYLKPASAEPYADPPTTNLLESDFYRVLLAPGGVLQITDKQLGRSLLDTDKFLGGELFTMQSVGEDAGEWSEPQQPTMEGFDRVSRHRPEWRIVESGPVRLAAALRQPLDHVEVEQKVSLYRTLKRIDFETTLLNWDGTPYREFRLAFPIAMNHGQVAYDVPFGTVEVGKSEMKGAAGERYRQEVSTIRPRSIQNWIGVSDENFGVTISSSVSVWDYVDPTDAPKSLPVLQPILLASRRSCHAEGPWYLQKGTHSFRFSLTSHAPGWREGRKAGTEANVLLWPVVNPIREPSASLPERKSFLEIDADSVVLTAMKKAESDESVVVRVYEDIGYDVVASLRPAFGIRDAWTTDLLEENGRPTELGGGGVRFFLGRNAIRTIKLRTR